MLVDQHFIASASPMGNALFCFLTAGTSINPYVSSEVEIETDGDTSFEEQPPEVTFNLSERTTDYQLERLIKKTKGLPHLKN